MILAARTLHGTQLPADAILGVSDAISRGGGHVLNAVVDLIDSTFRRHVAPPICIETDR
jgi:hypothetical protein